MFKTSSKGIIKNFPKGAETKIPKNEFMKKSQKNALRNLKGFNKRYHKRIAERIFKGVVVRVLTDKAG